MKSAVFKTLQIFILKNWAEKIIELKTRLFIANIILLVNKVHKNKVICKLSQIKQTMKTMILFFFIRNLGTICGIKIVSLLSQVG